MAVPKKLQGVNAIDITVTGTDLTQSFKVLPDKTASSPSGRHTTHYKVCFQDPSLSETLAYMISLPFKTGFSPSRWQKSIQVMLKKIAGFPLITKLRVIQLLEADMNLAFRILWGRRLISHAISHGVDTPWQFGNRPGTIVQSALLLKALSYDFLCLTCSPAIVFNNDAKACYDRVVPSLGLMATERLGMHATAATSMLATIFSMQYFIRTIYGLSPEFFNSIFYLLILGVLQGSGAAPCIWFCVSCVLFHALQQYTTGFNASCPCQLRHSNQLGEAFVDDTDLWLSSPNSNGLSLIPAMADLPCPTLGTPSTFASGGALALSKCFFYLICWKWDTHGNPSLRVNLDDTHVTFPMTSGRSTVISFIDRVECSEGRRTLGVRLTPDGSFTTELTYRITQASKWASNLTQSPLTREEVYTAYCTMWRPSVEYPLPVTSFTKAQCHKLQTSYTGTFLTHMGLPCTTAQEIIFGPYRYGGFAFSELWVRQGVEHITYLIGHLCSSDSVGNLLCININTLQLFLGFPYTPLSYSFSLVSAFLEPSWLTTTWEFLSDVDGLLEL